MFLIDTEAMRAVSDMVSKERLSLDDAVRIWRGQTVADSHPNKALHAEHLEWLLHGYVHQATVLSTIRNGVMHPASSERLSEPRVGIGSVVDWLGATETPTWWQNSAHCFHVLSYWRWDESARDRSCRATRWSYKSCGSGLGWEPVTKRSLAFPT